MAPKKGYSLPSPIPIGNCEVVVEAKKFTSETNGNTLQISLSKNVKIKISVVENMIGKNCNDIQHSGSEENGDFYFVLVNPKDGDSGAKFLLQDVLNIYTKELPTMNYAANTGKESMFLERCVSNGKYCTLLLKSKSDEGSGEVISAITYQIIPADMQYAEVPLAAVSSIYQRKGIGHLLYMSLRKRLQSIGIRTIFCWADKESEGFWLKQGFVSIGEVDAKGRARRLPIKSDIRRALCFPGGSTLMVSHLNKDSSAIPSEPLKLSFPLKPIEKSLQSAFVQKQGVGGIEESRDSSKAVNQMTASNECSQPAVLVNDGYLMDGSSRCHVSVQGCPELNPFEGIDCSNMAKGLGLNNIGPDAEVNQCSCSALSGKKRVWEASYTSLKSKKVKGGHLIDCQLDSRDLVSGSDGRNKCCFDEGSLAISKNKSLAEVTTRDPLIYSYPEKNVEECGAINMTLEDHHGSEELLSKGECFRIMLMNIANDEKKFNLTKIIEDLGGAVTSDGSVSTHVVTGKVRKTLNFCTALCSGAWIISPSWLKESFRKGRFVDETPFVLKDEDYELKYRTEINGAILRAKTSPHALLKGHDICLSAHVHPPIGTLSAIARSAGGNVIRGLDKVNEASKTIFVACEEDMDEALSAVKKGIWTFSSDWFMNCIMRQELDWEAPQFAESL
ncbi:uncharacterized protein LOC132313561 [Cornus florida]|uniref:uncharacterized protein LOC132313561 n=1 Tax=Cornus florida TaxID=4283 RepID=UPI0028A1C984|nr:uncharacterized protein LOC132313561 [Cornus florida]